MVLLELMNGRAEGFTFGDKDISKWVREAEFHLLNKEVELLIVTGPNWVS